MDMLSSAAMCSLADIKPGDRVIVRDIVFDMVRALCSPMDTCGGDVFECEALRPLSLVLSSRGGRRVEIDRFYACFVAVERVSSLAPAPWSPTRAVH
jgi:hypothetical protein